MAIPQADVAALRYGELAIALYAAPDLPYPERRRMSLQELGTHAAQGIRRLGGVDRVRSLHRALVAANRELLADRADPAVYEERVNCILGQAYSGPPDTGRYDRCVGYDFSRTRAA